MQILNSYQIKSTSQICAGLLDPVSTRVGLPGFKFPKGQLQPVSAVRATPGSSQLPLKAAHPAPTCGAGLGCDEKLPGRQGCADCDSAVDSYRFSCPWRADRRRGRSEGDVPSSCPIQANPVRLRNWNSTGPAKTHPADFRDPHFTDLAAEPAHVPRFYRDDSKAFIPPGFPPGRATVLASEKVRHRLRKIPQRLLLHRLATCSQPFELCACLSKLPCLLQITWRPAAPGLPPGLLLHGEVPYISCVCTVISQHRILRCRGRQPVTRHSNTLSKATDIPEEVKLHPSPGPRAWRNMPRSR